MTHINKIAYLAGWNTPDSLMRKWLVPLATELDLNLESLSYPGYGSASGDANDWDLDGLISRWSDSVDHHTLVIGWSLGGMLALKLAQETSCGAVITLASNLRFQGDQIWEMPAVQFDSFLKRFKRFPEKTNRAFWQLQVSGAQEPERQIALLEAHHEKFEAEFHCLVNSLELLGGLDLTKTSLNCPLLCLFAESDALVPVSASDHMKRDMANAVVQVVEGSHLMGESPQTFFEIHKWINQIFGQNGKLLHNG